MAYFITKADVIAIPVVFNRDVEENKIHDDLIESVTERHIMPILGVDFYDDVVANPSNYTDLKPYLVAVVANYTKYYMLPEIHSEISTAGVNVMTGQNKQPVPRANMEGIRQAVIDEARLQGQRLLKYLEDNEDTFTLYVPANNPQNRVEIAGGIVFDKSKNYEDIDDYYMKNLLKNFYLEILVFQLNQIIPIKEVIKSFQLIAHHATL